MKILKIEQPFLKRQFGVKRMAIFGSFAKGEASLHSDVDIFVEFNKPIGVQFFEFIEYLEKKMGRTADVLTGGGIKNIRFQKIAQDIKRSMIDV